MSDVTTLLPYNRSPLERELEVVTARSATVEAPLNTLWNPWECPASVLPWLAWAVGVREWSAAWPEARQRRVVAAAMGIRRRAGTAAAVREAVESLDIEGVEYSEWHEYGGQPGTYRIAATLTERGMDEGQYQELVRVIASSGRLSAWLDPVGFTVVGRARTREALAVLGGQATTVLPLRRTLREGRGVAYVGMATQGAVSVAVLPVRRERLETMAAMRVGMATQGAVTVAVYPPLVRRLEGTAVGHVALAVHAIAVVTVLPVESE
jgi:phage tail P2-like protein